MKLILVSEQNEEGEIAWVWVWRPGMRTARPLGREPEILQELDHCEVYGASRENVLDWICSRLTDAAPHWS